MKLSDNYKNSETLFFYVKGIDKPEKGVYTVVTKLRKRGHKQ